MAALVSCRPFVVSRRVSFAVKASPVSRLKYRRAARYLAVSCFAARKLQEAGVAPEKIDIVYDAAEACEFWTPWNREDPVVAPAFANDPKKLRALTVQACQLAGVPVVFSQRLMDDLQHASIFLYLTESEGLGSAALLAMQQGVPVIASRVEGLAEVFIDEVSGLYVDNKVEQIVAAIRRLLGGTQLPEYLRAGAKKRVEELFTHGLLISKTLRSYERALAG